MQVLVDGIVLGAGYALVAIGFALTYGVSGVLNAAHADFVMLGAFAFILFAAIGLPLLGAVALALIITSLLSGLLYILVFKRLGSTRLLAAFVASLGLSMILQYGVARVAGPDLTMVPSITPVASIELLGMFVTYRQIAIVGAFIVFGIPSVAIVRAQNLGSAMRAVSESETVAAMLGVNVGLVKFGTLALGGCLAAVAGVVLGNYFGAVSPFLGQSLGLKMFAAVLAAGLGRITGAMAIALGLGLFEAFVVRLWGAGLQSLGAMVLIVLVLLIRPQGVWGTVRRAG